MSDTLLAAALTAAARRIGETLPAAYGLEPGPVVVAGDIADHVMPEAATAVRWNLGSEDCYLVVAMTADAAAMLQAGPPEVDLTTALQTCVETVVPQLDALFDGQAPALGEPEEVVADSALADGPGDPVSVALSDGDVHRVTVGLRLVVTDSLLGPPPEEEPAADREASDGQSPENASSQDDPAEDVLPGDTPENLSGQDDPQGADGAMDLQDTNPSEPSATPGIVGSGGRNGRQTPTQRGPATMPPGEAHPADWASFDHLRGLPGSAHSMSLLADVELGVTAELGRTELTVRDVLGLTPGAIIELDRAAGSPVDVVVNGTLIARGEVVVIDEEFGIRITEILGMQDEADPFPMAQ